MKLDNKKLNKELTADKLSKLQNISEIQKLAIPPLHEQIKKISQVIPELLTENSVSKLNELSKLFIVFNPLKEFRETAKSVNSKRIFREISESVRAIQFSTTLDEANKSLLKETQKMVRDLQLKTPIKEVLDNFRDSIPRRTLSEQMRVLREGVSPIPKIFDSIPAARSMLDVYDSIFSDSISISAVDDAYKDIFTRFLVAESQNADSEIAARVVTNDITKNIVEAKKTILSYEFYLNLLITFAIFICTLQLSRKSEEKIINELNKTYQSVIKEIDKVRINKNDIYIEVKRTCNLWEKPTTESRIIAKLRTNLLMKSYKKTGNWYKVEYFDYTTESIKSGWCYGRFVTVVIPDQKYLQNED